MDFNKEISRLRAVIDKKLDTLLPSVKQEPKAVHKAMRYSVFSGGKRIRPIIVIEASKACGALRQVQGAVPSLSRDGGNISDAVIAGCAVELVHTYSLIHDDLPSMDDDDYRRGKPSCHKAFGEANAILAGDALLTLAFNVIAKNLKPGVSAGAAAELSDAIGTYGMVGGQALDMSYSAARPAKAAALKLINRLKTARLFEASSKLGAITVRAGRKNINALARYGDFLGTAFQITDDILDDDGYMKTFGVENARADTKRSVDKAKKALSAFGKKADTLNFIADRILERADGKTDRRDK
ncbi:MAG: polyprenyl synthetase family protein [Candidatus Omnitrophica bacterium]|nr:polyprenyl synthetase family protein [Candidatus Omnitrophota bacterium]